MAALATFAPMAYMKHLETLATDSQKRLQSLKANLRNIVLTRLGVFVVFGTAVYAFWWTPWLSPLLIVGGVALFLFLIKYHVNASKAKALEEAYLGLCTEEILISKGEWRGRSSGEAYTDPAHPYTSDLNIFGKHGLFQFLNRCQSPTAEAMLAGWLQDTPLSIDSIVQQRDTIRQFSANPDWSLRYLAIAKTALHEKNSDNAAAQSWHIPVLESPRGFVRIIFTLILPIVMLGLTLAYAFDAVGWNVYFYALLGAGAIAALRLKQHQAAFRSWALLSSGLEGAADLLSMLRERDFGESPYREKIKDARLEQSLEALKKLERINGAIDSRGNVVVGILLNLLLFWDFQCLYRILDWQASYGESMPRWLELMREAEAYQSLALYRFQHPHAVDVSWSNEPGIFCEGATHPLLGAEAVANPIDVTDIKQFAIITGANMAGKSTYLRTVGVLALMAMRGLPVTAGSMRMKPTRIYTSMLTTDSLGDHASYFFSELKRLRTLVDAIQSGQPHFVILDEILKGTNSVDKAEGSKLFMHKLLEMKLPDGSPAARGLIATHDLSLCAMAEEEPQRVENLSFEVEFEQGQLQFDYRLRKGVCQHMNASFLLKEMGLV